MDGLGSRPVNVGWRLPLAVAVGGAIGAGARWLAGVPFEVTPGTFPVRTLVVNVLGCLADRCRRGRLRRELAGVGVRRDRRARGFTTMSAFAQELNDLVDAGRAG